MTLAHLFDRDAASYDRDRQRLIPCYDDFYNTAIEIIPFNKDRELRVLDLGAGTGLLSSYVAARYLRAQLTLVDISTAMLDLAKQRFSENARVTCHTMDYGTNSLPGTYDLVVSALSIHHLTDELKQSLFQKIHHCLEPGGLFINADQIRGENYLADKIYHQMWRKKVLEKGISSTALTAAEKRMQEDRTSPLSSQLLWLKKAGFIDITSWYQYYGFAVYSGTKSLAANLP
ncbi:MAG: class I SAM-dependent methyltransferase [Desulforhopalus sp.]